MHSTTRFVPGSYPFEGQNFEGQSFKGQSMDKG
jgi:hypothetical protein